MLTEEKQALITEVVPRTLRSLFVLRITLCVVAACVAVGKILVSPPASNFFLDLLTDTQAQREVLGGWMRATNLLTSGLLAAIIALAVATLLIHARIKAQVQREIADADTSPAAQPA